ncbi:hypothetical protein NQZ79_g1629 [Umbelopsis isabellina]|nr:hypothetical protein NQZ79_g1629 [Umbelopsis isabellina]
MAFSLEGFVVFDWNCDIGSCECSTERTKDREPVRTSRIAMQFSGNDTTAMHLFVLMAECISCTRSVSLMGVIIWCEITGSAAARVDGMNATTDRVFVEAIGGIHFTVVVR